MLSALASRGHDIVACARRVDLETTPKFGCIELGDGGRLESLWGLTNALAARRALRQLGGSARFDVAHWIFPQGRDNALDVLPRRLPLVIGPIGFSWSAARREFHPGSVLRWLTDPAHRIPYSRGIRRAELLVTVPEVAQEIAVRHASDCTVAPYGIHPERFVVRPLPEVPTVLFLGRLEPFKGVKELYEAFRLVKRYVPAARLRVAGEGSLQRWLEQRRTADGRQEDVELLGAVPRHEVPALMAESSLLCVPSIREAFGMVYLEAMASGRAVVAADWGGPRHLVRPQGGRLVPPGDVDAISSALKELLTDQHALRRCGDFNRARVLKEFSWTGVIDRVEDAYSRALGERTSARRRGIPGEAIDRDPRQDRPDHDRRTLGARATGRVQPP